MVQNLEENTHNLMSCHTLSPSCPLHTSSHDTPCTCSPCHVDEAMDDVVHDCEDIWMTADGGDEDEDELQHEAVFMMNPGNHHQPLQQADQALRDEILGSLALASSDRERSPRRNGAQEEVGGGQEQGPCLGEVRLQQNRGAEVGRLALHGPPLVLGNTCRPDRVGAIPAGPMRARRGALVNSAACSSQEDCLRRPGEIFGGRRSSKRRQYGSRTSATKISKPTKGTVGLRRPTKKVP